MNNPFKIFKKNGRVLIFWVAVKNFHYWNKFAANQVYYGSKLSIDSCPHRSFYCIPFFNLLSGHLKRWTFVKRRVCKKRNRETDKSNVKRESKHWQIWFKKKNREREPGRQKSNLYLAESSFSIQSIFFFFFKNYWLPLFTPLCIR